MEMKRINSCFLDVKGKTERLKYFWGFICVCRGELRVEEKTRELDGGEFFL